MRKRWLILALVVLLGTGLSFTPTRSRLADQVNFPDIYLDESVAPGGVGSLADPYSDFSEINWTTGGDNSVFDAVAANEDVTVNLQMGEEWRETLTVGTSGSAAHPITIQSYGTGADPIINGADIIGTWTEASVAWATAWSETLNDDTSSGSEIGIRIEIPNAAISVGGNQIRVTLETASDAGVIITGCSIGEQAAAGDAYDFATTPTRITFDTGNNGCTITAGNTKTSDAIVFTVDAARDYLVNCYIASDRAYRKLTSGAATTNHYKSEPGQDDTMTANVTDWTSQAAICTLVQKLEVYTSYPNVWQATLTTEPTQVFFDGVRGALQASIAACTAAGHWFWDSNVLYVYYEEDPDGAVSIEASARSNIFNFNANDYITLDGLTVKYSNATGILVTGDNFIIQNCTSTYNSTQQMSLWGTSSDITSGTISTNTLSYSNTGQGLFLGESADGPTGVTIEYNTINNNGSAEGDNGIYLDYADSNIIRYNLIYSNYDNNVQLQHGSDSNQLYYNLVYSAGADGLWIGTGDGGDSNLIYNNVFYENTDFGIKVGAGSSNVIKNNIIQQVSGGGGSAYCMRALSDAVAQGQTWDYNRYYYPGAASANDIIEIGTGATTLYTLAEWQAYTGTPGANSTVGDPLMTDPANDDFTLSYASPCINAGTDVGLTEDYAGNPVGPIFKAIILEVIKPIIHGIINRPDIGAYEYQY